MELDLPESRKINFLWEIMSVDLAADSTPHRRNLQAPTFEYVDKSQEGDFVSKKFSARKLKYELHYYGCLFKDLFAM